jgi:hypothetical protein
MELLPAAGVAAALATVIFYLLNANRTDRIEHRKERAEWDKRFKELQSRHDTEITDLRERIETLEKAKRDETLRADRAEAQLERAGRAHP